MYHIYPRSWSLDHHFRHKNCQSEVSPMDKPASSLALKLEAQSQPVTASVARSDFPTEETPSSSMEWLEENSLDTTSICPSSNIVFWGRYCLAIPTAFGLGFPMPDLLWSSCNGGYSALPGKSLWTNCCETILLWVNTGYPPELVSSCWLTVIPYWFIHNVNEWFMYVLVTNLWGSDLHLNSIFPQRVPSEAKNEAKTRPKRGQKIALEPPQL